MEIFKLFREQMKQATRLANLESELRRAQRSLSRRDRRIGELKKKLNASRAQSDSGLAEYKQIIAGLEQALMLHNPRTGRAASDRIAELEAQLAAMTEYADALHERAAA